MREERYFKSGFLVEEVFGSEKAAIVYANLHGITVEDAALILGAISTQQRPSRPGVDSSLVANSSSAYNLGSKVAPTRVPIKTPNRGTKAPGYQFGNGVQSSRRPSKF